MLSSAEINLENIQNNKKLVYIVSDTDIPFWDIMGRGIKSKANQLGYEIDIYNSSNSKKIELESTIKIRICKPVCDAGFNYFCHPRTFLITDHLWRFSSGSSPKIQ